MAVQESFFSVLGSLPQNGYLDHSERLTSSKVTTVLFRHGECQWANCGAICDSLVDFIQLANNICLDEFFILQP